MSLLITSEWSQSTWAVQGKTVCWWLHQDASLGEVLWIMYFSGLAVSLSKPQERSGECWITNGSPTSSIYTCFSECNQEFAGLEDRLWAHFNVAIILWDKCTKSWHLGITWLAKSQGENPPACPAIHRKSKACKEYPTSQIPARFLEKIKTNLRGELHHERELSQLLVGGWFGSHSGKTPVGKQKTHFARYDITRSRTQTIEHMTQ